MCAIIIACAKVCAFVTLFDCRTVAQERALQFFLVVDERRTARTKVIVCLCRSRHGLHLRSLTRNRLPCRLLAAPRVALEW